MSIKTETCDGKCGGGECVCPETFERLFFNILPSDMNDVESVNECKKHAQRICANYIRKALDKSYLGETVTETTLKKEDIK